jgi:precorrin-2/cobalt-factor-2 C20-methyltransferase
MKGKLYGIGVGPGDPELMTLKAVRMIENCDILAVPGKKKEDSVAYRIACGATNLSKKECLGIYMPMTKDRARLKEAHENGIRTLREQLDEGKTVAFLTLGDPTVYSTYMYLHKGIAAMGYETEIISGIPSFCAAAARLNISLVEKAEELHVIPATYQTGEALDMPGTKVFMKTGKTMGALKEKLCEAGGEIYMVENCGMENEKLYYSAEEIDEHAGYYSLVILKDAEKKSAGEDE